jgi:predicted component of type VI protein secretion system
LAAHDQLFWPSLYSRLTPSRYQDEASIEFETQSDDGDREAFGIARHFVDFDTLRRQIEVELQSLLNATSLESVLLGAFLRGLPADRVPIEKYPFHHHERVRTSVVNYGLPAFIGRNVYALPLNVIEMRLCDAIQAFEPRIRRATMRVQVKADEKRDRIPPDRALEFFIEGEVFGPSESSWIAVRTYWDPEKIRTAVADVEVRR